MQDHDWQKLAPEIARRLLGEPKVQKSNEWRWNNKGSLTLNLEAGTFYDFELGQGGGVTWLLEQHGKDVAETLKQFGYERPLPSTISNSVTPIARTGGGRSFSREQMVDLYRQSEIKFKYADNFMVLRNANLPMKYAPFSLNPNGTWSMKRPEGLLPLYITNKYLDKPVLISEGEKATLGSTKIWNFDVCTWHGGATGWNKTDWSAIYGREVYIWADNDEAGIKCANEIAGELKKNGCKTKVIQPPETFNDKDDLWDAAALNYFESPQAFDEYLKNNLDKSPRGSFKLMSIADMESNIKEPEWLIDKILERETIGSIFGSPKSGKSLISLSMMMSIANGTDWFGHSVTQTPVVLFCGEGERSMHKRILSWAKFHEESVRDNPFRMSDRPARILDDEDFALIMQTLKNTKDELGDIGCVCIDTLQRNWGGGDENSSSDMGKFIQRVDEIKYEFKANVVIVHHSGHVGGKSRARGSSVLPSSVDFEFQVDRQDGPDDDPRMYTTIKQTLNKEGADLPPINFEVVPVHNLKGYAAQGSATVDLTEFVPGKEDKDPDNLTAVNNAITIIHSEKIKALGDPYKAMVSIDEIVKYLDDEKKTNTWVNKQLTRYKEHKSHCWVSPERGLYQCENLLTTPF